MGRLPEGIDGLEAYHIENYHDIDALQDGRKWKKNCPTEWKDHGRTRYADCCSSFKCTRERCPFETEYGVINTTQFESRGGGGNKHVKDVALKVSLFHITRGGTFVTREKQ